LALVSLFAMSGVLLIVEIGSTGDTPCGSVVSRNFEWHPDPNQLCGIVYTGSSATAGVLSPGAVGLVLVRRSRAGTTRVLGAISALTLTALVAEVAQTAFIDEPVIRRAWTALRPVGAASATLACGLWLLARRTPARARD
jgi:hypothetical protein